VVVLEEIVIT